GEGEKAGKDLARARALNPRDEETLGRVAAALLAQRKAADFAALAKEVEQHDKKPYVFYTELAAQLDARKAYFDSEKYFKIAADLQPKLPEAQAGLGMLYMRLGREEEATKVL